MAEFSKTARGQQILAIYQTDDIDHCKVEELDSFDKFYKEYLQLKKQVNE